MFEFNLSSSVCQVAGEKEHVSRLNHPGEAREEHRVEDKGRSHVRLEWMDELVKMKWGLTEMISGDF